LPNLKRSDQHSTMLWIFESTHSPHNSACAEVGGGRVWRLGPLGCRGVVCAYLQHICEFMGHSNNNLDRSTVYFERSRVRAIDGSKVMHYASSTSIEHIRDSELGSAVRKESRLNHLPNQSINPYRLGLSVAGLFQASHGFVLIRAVYTFTDQM